MAQAQLYNAPLTDHLYKHLTVQKADISVTGDLKIRFRQKSKKDSLVIVLFFYEGKNSYSLPLYDFMKLLSSPDIVQELGKILSGTLSDSENG